MIDTALRYNVRWIEHTFSSRPVTESLLSPERESGNLTTKDYEAATNFFPGPSRRYRVGLFMPLQFLSAKRGIITIGDWWHHCAPCYICRAQALVDQHTHLYIHDHRLCRWCSHWAYDVYFCTL